MPGPLNPFGRMRTDLSELRDEVRTLCIDSLFIEIVNTCYSYEPTILIHESACCPSHCLHSSVLQPLAISHQYRSPNKKKAEIPITFLASPTTTSPQSIKSASGCHKNKSLSAVANKFVLGLYPTIALFPLPGKRSNGSSTFDGVGGFEISQTSKPSSLLPPMRYCPSGEMHTSPWPTTGVLPLGIFALCV